MGRKEFMEQLAALLGDISPQEREEALDYYERYFDEAGDDLQQAIDHLGSPQKVAQDIKSGLKGEYFYTENGAESAASDTESKTPAFYVEEEKKGDRAKASAAKWSFWSWWEDQNTIMRVIWFALALAILIPAAGAVLGTATGLLGGLIGIVVGIFGLIIGILAGALRHYDRGLYIWSSQYCLRSRDAVCKPISRSDVPRPWMYRPCRWDFYDISVHMALSENASGSDPDGRKSTS